MVEKEYGQIYITEYEYEDTYIRREIKD